MVYFTSDLHFGHANIIRHCDRPFDCVDEMDHALIKNWNSRVGESDTVYIVGDMFFYSSSCIDSILQTLNGKKHLIIGNHDKQWMKRTDLNRYFESVTPMLELKDNRRRFTLCHYPMMTWNNVGQGAFLIYGHIHNNTADFYWSLLKSMDNAFNAGVDINGFSPVTFEELVENNRKFKENI